MIANLQATCKSNLLECEYFLRATTDYDAFSCCNSTPTIDIPLIIYIPNFIFDYSRFTPQNWNPQVLPSFEMSATIQNQSPMIQGGNVPMMKEGNLQIMQGGNIPMMQGGNMPMMQGGNIPMMQGGDSLMMQGGNIPMMQEGDSPMMQGGNIPMMQGGESPMIQGDSTMMQDGNVPMMQGGSQPNFYG